MPRRTGLDALPEIKRVAPDAKAIVVSGFATSMIAADALAHGADRYIEKARTRAVWKHKTATKEGAMQAEPPPPQPRPDTEPVEARGARLRRHGHRTGLYAWAFALVALLVIVIALAVANTRQVKLSWVVGTSHASLVWIILAAAVLGWLLGIITSVVFRLRTRRRGPT
jgi:uncharacterized integral membrane protein